MFTLQQDKPQELQNFLLKKGWLYSGEKIEKISVPGAGNMNVTLRISTNQRRFILKQSLPYVAKYPQVKAPVERILREAEFYDLMGKNPDLTEYTPRLLGLDKSHYLLAMEDLGDSLDFTFLYKQNSCLPEGYLKALMEFLTALHNLYSGAREKPKLSNRAMRKLNHEHIFTLPFMADNGLDLDQVQPGLAHLAQPFQNDQTLRKEASKLGERYLHDGDVLLHGDFFPGSWMQCNNQLKVLDPEFGFMGFAEFDFAVMQAHLLMAAQPQDLITKAQKLYTEKRPLDEGVLQKYTGIEILRRLIGLAQLPLSLNINQKKRLLEMARAMVLE